MSLANLDFSDDPEIAQRQLQDFCNRVNGDLYGNGRVGFMEEMRQYMHSAIATAVEQERTIQQRHRENQDALASIGTKIGGRSLAWTVAGVMVAVCVGALTIILMVKLAKADVHLPWASSENPPAYARSN